MGIVNVTPDSFSDGKANFSIGKSIEHAYRLLDEGADLLDIGGESTRPGATPVGRQEELDRVLPVVKELASSGVPLSVDTYKPAVMQEVLAAGASMINDITGFTNPDSVAAVAHSNCGICIMHMQGKPATMQKSPVYNNVVTDVQNFLLERIQVLQQAGVNRVRIVLDPGFGFGKTIQQNYELLRTMPTSVSGFPWLLGVSRKSMIGHVVGDQPDQRLSGSIAAALAGVQRGANILRVHDVKETINALRVWQAVENGSFL